MLRIRGAEVFVRAICLRTLFGVASLPDVALHLEVAVLGAEVYIGRKHYLHIAFFHGDGWGIRGRCTREWSRHCEVQRLALQLRKWSLTLEDSSLPSQLWCFVRGCVAGLLQ
jgi:hypothetical protein